jgi:hypothetical protein
MNFDQRILRLSHYRAVFELAMACVPGDSVRSCFPSRVLGIGNAPGFLKNRAEREQTVPQDRLAPLCAPTAARRLGLHPVRRAAMPTTAHQACSRTARPLGRPAQRHRPARPAATGTPASCSTAGSSRSGRRLCPARTAVPPAVPYPPGGPGLQQSTRDYPPTSCQRPNPSAPPVTQARRHFELCNALTGNNTSLLRP